jgi:Protein of unknown function (DUF2795)
MNFQRAAEIQVLLEGIALPAMRDDLVRYAAPQDAAAAAELERLPDRRYERLDDVGEELAPTAPVRESSPSPLPRAESGEPPGGADYVKPHPDGTGEVRVGAPPGNPPQQAIRKASETQKDQQDQ